MSLNYFPIKIGNITEDPLVAAKAPVWINSNVPILPTSTLDQRSPTFIIDYSESYLGANYIECPKLGRKYFIQNKSVEIGKRIIFTCIVDPLSSFDLSNCQIAVIRNEGIGAPTPYPDSKLPVYPSKKNIGSIIMEETSQLLTANGNECYVLTIIGSKSTS